MVEGVDIEKLKEDVKSLIVQNNELLAASKLSAVVGAELNNQLKAVEAHIESLEEATNSMAMVFEKGFTIIGDGTKLFKLVILSFLAVIVILAAVVVYITQVDISAFGVNLRSQPQHDSKRSNAPKVDFSKDSNGNSTNTGRSETVLSSATRTSSN